MSIGLLALARFDPASRRTALIERAELNENFTQRQRWALFIVWLVSQQRQRQKFPVEMKSASVAHTARACTLPKKSLPPSASRTQGGIEDGLATKKTL